MCDIYVSFCPAQVSTERDADGRGLWKTCLIPDSYGGAPDASVRGSILRAARGRAGNLLVISPYVPGRGSIAPHTGVGREIALGVGYMRHAAAHTRRWGCPVALDKSSRARTRDRSEGRGG